MNKALVLSVLGSCGLAAMINCGDDATSPPPGTTTTTTTTTTTAGGGGTGGDGGATGGGGGATGGAAPVATQPSKGSSIAVDEAGLTIAAANKATDDVTFFDREALTERGRVKVGDEPVSVVLSADGKTAYVVNRAGQSVSVVTGADGDQPTVAATIDVGSEPSHAALSPTGATLYVSNWADGTLSVIDTASEKVTGTIALGGAPHAVCASNNGNADDADETVYVTDFYARPKAGVKEATDGSRVGRVFAVRAGDQSVTSITLEPLAVTGVEAGIDAAKTSAFANQLYGCVINKDRLYVTAVGASPAAFNKTTDFRQNVHGLVYAVDTQSGKVDDKKTVVLSQLVAKLANEKRFVSVPADIAFAPNSDFGYIASLAGNAVQRVDFGQDPPTAGAANANFLPVDASPTGIAIFQSNAYTYNEVARTISHVDLATQTHDQDVASAPQPSSQKEQDELKGQRFFNTATGRWAQAAWVGCVACHPMGTTDNVTWVFPAGPRQTVDTATTYDKTGTIQRVLNWSAIFDEVHDFELNTRGVSNGVGAIVSDTALDVKHRIDFVGPGGVPNPTNGFNIGSVKGINAVQGKLDDWDKIDAYIRSIRSPRGAKTTDGDAAAGRKVFEAANCQFCHGGPLWTLAEMYYTPVFNGDLRKNTFGGEGITSFGMVRPDQVAVKAQDLAGTAVILNDANGAPQRHLCTVRIVGTFDADGPDMRGADEIRQSGTAAQGIGGFNVPSLLNVNTGAPYLHNAAAETLEALFDPKGAFVTHLQAGNQVFVPTAQEQKDLIAFVRSIDDTTATFTVPAGQRFCPTGVVPK